MAQNRGFRAQLPEGIEIGERFLLRFDDPNVKARSYQGRLQDMSKSGLLCFDAPRELKPPRGTPVTVLSIGSRPGAACSFSSEIRGRGRLRGHLPVLLVEPPQTVEKQHRRNAHRIHVCIRASLTWKEHPRCPDRHANAVVTNLSGGGAQVFSRQEPETDFVRLHLEVPEAFVEQLARRNLSRTGLPPRRLASPNHTFGEACERVRERFEGIQAHLVHHRVHSHDERGPVYALSLAFAEAQESCFQMVRYLERLALRKGLRSPEPAADRRRGHGEGKRRLAAAA